MGCARCVGRHKKAQSQCVPLRTFALQVSSPFALTCAPFAQSFEPAMGSSWTEVQCLSFSNSATLTLKDRGGDAMRYLRVMMLVSICGLSTPVFAESVAPLDVRPTSSPRVAFLMVRRTPAVRLHALQLLQRTRGPTDRPRLENSSRPQDPPALVSAPPGRVGQKMC